jgi:hypothetical protein
MTPGEKKNLVLDKTTGQITLRDKKFQGQSPQYKKLTSVINDDNTATVRIIAPGDPEMFSSAANQSVSYDSVAKSAGGRTGISGVPTGADGGRDVDVFLAEDGNPGLPSHGLPAGHVLGADGNPIRQFLGLLSQHELLGHGLFAMLGRKEYFRDAQPDFTDRTAIDVENQIRRYSGQPSRGCQWHP